MKNWFESWFDSPYYHILYKHRSDSEAEAFIDQVYQHFEIDDQKTILDLACGKGRHSLYMAQKGNSVVGADLAPNSIAEAKKTALEGNLNDKASFSVEDMRNFQLQRKFDYIFNLFTSFGYFDDKDDNQKVIQSIADHQDAGGIFILDYLNSQLVRSTGEVKETKLIEDIEFHTHKYVDDQNVYKDIKINDRMKNQQLEFRERVQLFEKDEIQNMLTASGYEIQNYFGDYKLNPYTSLNPRCILVAKKL